MAEVAMTEEKNADERPVVLKVDHVAKMFRLPTEQATGLKMAFLNWTKGIKGYTEQHVLRDIISRFAKAISSVSSGVTAPASPRC